MTRSELFPVMSMLHTDSRAFPSEAKEGADLPVKSGQEGSTALGEKSSREVNVLAEDARPSAPILHEYDGSGLPIEGGPITTAQACEQGVALFEETGE